MRDVNGADALRALPVVVADRAPGEAALSGDLPVAHSYDAAAQRYRATKVMSRWSDPDGDPLLQAAPTGDAHCAALALLADGTAVIECGQAFSGRPTLADFATGHLVQQVVGDPWTSATTGGAYGVRIANQPPTASSTTSTVTVSCPEDRSNDFCCHLVGDMCVSFPRIIPAVTYTFTPQVSDADGDPLEVRLEVGSLPTSTVCLPGQCAPVARTLPMVSGCNAMPGGETTSFTATDGVASATGSHTVTRVCR